jgi:hypothetical protein
LSEQVGLDSEKVANKILPQAVHPERVVGVGTSKVSFFVRAKTSAK